MTPAPDDLALLRSLWVAREELRKQYERADAVYLDAVDSVVTRYDNITVTLVARECGIRRTTLDSALAARRRRRRGQP